MRVCPHCQLPTLETGSYCPSCGKALLVAAPKAVQQAMMGTFRFPPAVAARQVPSGTAEIKPVTAAKSAPDEAKGARAEASSPARAQRPSPAPAPGSGPVSAFGATLPLQAIRDEEVGAAEGGWKHEGTKPGGAAPPPRKSKESAASHQAIRGETPPSSPAIRGETASSFTSTLPLQAIRGETQASFAATLPHPSIREGTGDFEETKIRGAAPADFEATLQNPVIVERADDATEQHQLHIHHEARSRGGTLPPPPMKEMAALSGRSGVAARASGTGASLAGGTSASGTGDSSRYGRSGVAGSGVAGSGVAGLPGLPRPAMREEGSAGASVSAPYSAASHGVPALEEELRSDTRPDQEPRAVSMGTMTEDSIPIPDPRHALLGTVVDGFAIDSILGSGGCGTVYRGRQLGLDRPVALKVPTFDVVDDPILKKRFLREARSAARVKHPSVVTIYGVGEVPDGRPYLAMELLEGVSLLQVLDDGPLDVDRALGLARQIALALAETHAAGVVHRDLKPSNVIWRRGRGGEDRITIVDFGIAAGQQGSADATRLTAGGKVIGTPHYMAPEQAQGEHEDIDHRTDLYALGCVLFELLTCEVPFDGTGFEVVLAHMTRQPDAPSQRLARIPREVDALVLALMRKRPAERPSSAEEVVARIDEVRAQLAATDRTEPAMQPAAAALLSGIPSSYGPAHASQSPAHGVPQVGGGLRRSPVGGVPQTAMHGGGSGGVGAASTMMAQVDSHRGVPGSHPQIALPAVSQPHLTPPGSTRPSYPQLSGLAGVTGLTGRPSRPQIAGYMASHAPPKTPVPGSQPHLAPPPPPPRPLTGNVAPAGRRKWWALLAALAAVGAVAVVVGLMLPVHTPDGLPGAAGSQAGEPPWEKPDPTPVPQPSAPARVVRKLMLISGEYSMEMEAVSEVEVRTSLHAELKLWALAGSDEAEPLNREVTVTIAPPSKTGKVQGFTIRSGATDGVYDVPLMFFEVGRHMVRIFPNDTDATFEIEFDVVLARGDEPATPG